MVTLLPAPGFCDSVLDELQRKCRPSKQLPEHSDESSIPAFMSKKHGVTVVGGAAALANQTAALKRPATAMKYHQLDDAGPAISDGMGK